MENKLIYIADDEANICAIIQSFLIKEGYAVETFPNGRALLEAFTQKPADMCVIDVMMPELDGYSLCVSLRQMSDAPIIIVSAKDTSVDKIAGLTLGCDDYMTKPFSPMELIMRIKNIFKRVGTQENRPKVESALLDVHGLVLNPSSKQVHYQSQLINLTGMEFNLLHYLVQNQGRAVSRTELLDKVWGFESAVETRATDDMIKRIRRKLAEANAPVKIETVWGFGFIIEGEK